MVPSSAATGSPSRHYANPAARPNADLAPVHHRCLPGSPFLCMVTSATSPVHGVSRQPLRAAREGQDVRLSSSSRHTAPQRPSNVIRAGVPLPCFSGSAQHPINLTDPYRFPHRRAHAPVCTHRLAQPLAFDLDPSFPRNALEIDQTLCQQGLSTASRPREARILDRIRTVPPEKSHLSRITADPRHLSESPDIRGLTAQPIPKSLTFDQTGRSPKRFRSVPKNLTLACRDNKNTIAFIHLIRTAQCNSDFPTIPETLTSTPSRQIPTATRSSRKTSPFTKLSAKTTAQIPVLARVYG